MAACGMMVVPVLGGHVVKRLACYQLSRIGVIVCKTSAAGQSLYESIKLSQAVGAIVVIMNWLHLRERKVADTEFTAAARTSSPTTRELFDDGISNVPEKYRGTAADRHDMAVMGNKQVLRVSIPNDIATVLALNLSSETSLLSPCSALHLHA